MRIASPPFIARRKAFVGLVLLLLVVHGVSLRAEALRPVELSDSLDRMDITASVGFLQDLDGTLTVDDVSILPESAFVRTLNSALFFGFDPGAVWLRITLDNQSSEGEWLIELNNPRLDEVLFYLPDEAGGRQVSKVGRNHPVENRPARHVMPAVCVPLEPGSSKTLFIRVSHIGSLRFQVFASTMDRFMVNVSRVTAISLTLIGGLLVMVLFNLAVFLLLRERAYFYLSAGVFSFLLLVMAMNGHGYVYLWSNSFYWSVHSVNTTSMLHHAFLCMFFYAFIRQDEHSHRDRMAAATGAAVALAAALLSLTDWWFKFPVVNFLSAAIPVLLEVLAIRSYRRGYSPALYFILAWTLAIAGALLVFLANGGFIPHGYLNENMVFLAYLVSAVLWNVSLADRLRLSQIAARDNLEQQVRKRTTELEEALNEVKTLSGLLPICSTCKKIRDDQGYWQGVEHYIHKHTDATFTHGMCPDCFKEHYPEYAYRTEPS